MDQQQKQNINQAAEQLTESTQQAFRTLADRRISFQESNLKLTQNFLENWMEQVNNLTQGTREATQRICRSRVSASGRPSRRSLRRRPTPTPSS
jgi:hypothetical protein